MDNLIVGARQTQRALQRRMAEEVLVAKNADTAITGPIVDLCIREKVPIREIPTMEELGRYCSIDRGASVACLMKQSESENSD